MSLGDCKDTTHLEATRRKFLKLSAFIGSISLIDMLGPSRR